MSILVNTVNQSQIFSLYTTTPIKIGRYTNFKFDASKKTNIKYYKSTSISVVNTVFKKIDFIYSQVKATLRTVCYTLI